MALTPRAAPEVRALGDPAERTVLVLNPITQPDLRDLMTLLRGLIFKSRCRTRRADPSVYTLRRMSLDPRWCRTGVEGPLAEVMADPGGDAACSV